MEFWHAVLKALDTAMERPALYGWFHILFLVITFAALFLLWRYPKYQHREHVRKVVLTTALIVIFLEVYKQINYSFLERNKFVFDYQWYAFPFQFCSTPMYVGLLAGLIKRGKVHDSLCAYLATYAIFAGLAVMIYPGDVFVETVGINIQTMICHGSMITIGFYLYASGHVKCSHKTILKALPVFAVTVVIAMIMNEIAHASGLLETERFNMFYFSPYCEGTLPVYSLVQPLVPYPVSLIIYIAGFTAAAYLMLLIAMGVKKLSTKLKKTAVAG